MFWNYYRFRCAVSVSWNLHFDCVIVITDDRFCSIPITTITGIISGIIVFLLANIVLLLIEYYFLSATYTENFTRSNLHIKLYTL